MLSKTVSDPDKVQQVPEPFESIPAQELLRDNCRHCGWIRKEGGSIKTWTDRYTIIHKGCLYYYNKPEATTTAGKFSLSGYRLSPAPEKSSKYQWTFKLVNLQPEKRTFYFAAYSEQEMNEWMQKLSEDMEEYCGVAAQKTPSNIKQAEDQLEYCYPEVEPQHDPKNLPAVLRQLVLSPQPLTDEMYCPPPDLIDTPIRPQQRKLPPVPEARKEPIGHGVPKFSYTGGPGVGSGHERLPPASGNFPSLGPSPPRRNPSPSHRETPTPPVPLRPRKPGPGPPLPITPPMRRKPEPIPRKFLKEPKVPVENVGIQDTGGIPDEDEVEDYLAIVPDTHPRDFREQGKKSTLQRRGDPDGKSFRQPRLDDVLPPSAVRLDLDKTQVAPLLKRKLGVYIMRESQSTQSKRALSVWTGEKVSHYLVFYEQRLGYALEPEEGPRFNSIENLVRHYFEYNLPNTEVKLTMPYK